MTIYVDIVLIENLIMNYIILYATSIILRRKAKKCKLIIGSLVGAIYSITAYIITIPIYSSLTIKFILSIIIVYISFNAQNVRQLARDILIFYLISFAFGGVAFALIYVVKPQDILMKNGLFLGTYALKTVSLGAIVAFLLVIGGFKVLKIKMTKKDMLCDIVVSLNGKEIETKAMIDSGNLLREPITNTPVIILEHTLLYKCMPKEILNNLEKIIRR